MKHTVRRKWWGCAEHKFRLFQSSMSVSGKVQGFWTLQCMVYSSRHNNNVTRRWERYVRRFLESYKVSRTTEDFVTCPSNEREYFLHQQSSALASKDPMIPKVQAILKELIQYSILYQWNIKWLDENAQMEATARIVSNWFVLHYVVLKKKSTTLHVLFAHTFNPALFYPVFMDSLFLR